MYAHGPMCSNSRSLATGRVASGQEPSMLSTCHHAEGHGLAQAVDVNPAACCSLPAGMCADVGGRRMQTDRDAEARRQIARGEHSRQGMAAKNIAGCLCRHGHPPGGCLSLVAQHSGELVVRGRSNEAVWLGMARNQGSKHAAAEHEEAAGAASFQITSVST